MAKPSGSVSVGRQVQERTHKGGAVLWFLRKHALMPVPYCNFELPTLPSEEKIKTQKTSSRKSREGPKNVSDAHPQRKFLHGTLLVIGSELDHPPDGGSFERPYPQGARIDSHTLAWSARESLSRRYLDHTSFELEQLQKAVAAKEQEVLALRRQVDQMENYLAAKRTVSSRHADRKRDTQDGKSSQKILCISGAGDKLTSPIGSARKTLRTTAGLSVWDAEETPRKEREDIMLEEWQDSIMRQSELAQTMRAHLDEQIKALQQQTIHRKSQEAALFCSQIKSLKLHAQAQASEARVQRLANELKRVYQSMPEAIEKNLEYQTYDAVDQLRKAEITALKLEHHSEFCKYLDGDAIQEEGLNCIKRTSDIAVFVESARNVLLAGRNLAEAEMSQAKMTETAINALHDRWSRFDAAGHRAGELTIHGMSEGADCILQRSMLCASAIMELLLMLSEDEATTGKYKSDHESNRLLTESRASTSSDLNAMKVFSR